MRREEEERAVMLGSLGALYTLGIPGRLEPHLSARAAAAFALPLHPWQRERCWMETAQAEADSLLERAHAAEERQASSAGPAFQIGASCGNPLLGSHPGQASAALSG